MGAVVLSPANWTALRPLRVVLLLCLALARLWLSTPTEAVPALDANSDPQEIARVVAGRVLVGASLVGWSYLVSDLSNDLGIQIAPGTPAELDETQSDLSSLLAYGVVAAAPFLGVGFFSSDETPTRPVPIATASVTTVVIGAAYAARTYGKSVFRRPRPYIDGDLVSNDPEAYQSFPSGHTLLSWACVGDAVAGWIRGTRDPWAAAVLAVGATAVSYLRWSSGSHYAGDVLAGAAAGFLLGTALSLASL